LLNIALFEQVRELDSLVVLAGPLQLSLGGSLGPTLPITATVILHRLNWGWVGLLVPLFPLQPQWSYTG